MSFQGLRQHPRRSSPPSSRCRFSRWSPPRPPIWTWGAAICAVLTATYFVRTTLRSPTVRKLFADCRFVMVRNFTSVSARPASRRFNTVGNRAMLTFGLYVAAVLTMAALVIPAVLPVISLVYGGLWAGGAVAVLYFIITRWPDAADAVSTDQSTSFPLELALIRIMENHIAEIEESSCRYSSSPARNA